MSVPVDTLKEIATLGLRAKFGDDMGKALGYLFFGGPGFYGIADSVMLAAQADKISGTEVTTDIAVSIATEAAKAGIAKGLESAAAAGLEASGLTAETLASAATIVVAGILEPSAIGDEKPPVPPANPSPVKTSGGGGAGMGPENGRSGSSTGPIHDAASAAAEAARRSAAQSGYNCEVDVTEADGDGKITTLRIRMLQQ